MLTNRLYLTIEIFPEITEQVIRVDTTKDKPAPEPKIANTVTIVPEKQEPNPPQKTGNKTCCA